MALRKFKLTPISQGNYELRETGATTPPKKIVAPRAEAVKKAAAIVAKTGGSMQVRNLNQTVSEERTYPKKDDPKRSKG